MASMVTRICGSCKNEFEAREADVKHGWAKYCSKSCKAIKQEQRTGQYRQLMERLDENREPTFDNAHQFDNTEL